MAGENRRWSIEASLVRREDRRKGKASHMDLLEEASEGGEGAGRAESAEKRVIRWARTGVNRGLARPSGSRRATCGAAEAGR